MRIQTKNMCKNIVAVSGLSALMVAAMAHAGSGSTLIKGQEVRIHAQQSVMPLRVPEADGNGRTDKSMLGAINYGNTGENADENMNDGTGKSVDGSADSATGNEGDMGNMGDMGDSSSDSSDASDNTSDTETAPSDSDTEAAPSDSE